MRRQRLVVIGNGMAGGRFVEDLLARGGADRFAITMFGDEPHGNYNRILLSSVLAGDHRPSEIITNSLAWYAARGVVVHAGVRIDRLDLARRQVADDNGIAEDYDTLVIATGSSPFVPPMDGLLSGGGVFRDGIFVFRTLDDCDRILGYAAHARRAVVIGGGLLGIEAARGLMHRGLDVQVVHIRPHVMDAQLDPAAGSVLQDRLDRMGLKVHVDKVTTAVLGNGHVTGVAFNDGSTLDCDMVVMSAGIRPNVELAARAGLRVNRGIAVGDDLGCADAPGVYAVGECAEHRGQVYGLVAPLWEQTQVLADRLSGRQATASYLGSRTSTKLKVAGVDVAVMGAKEPEQAGDEVVTYVEGARGVYKKLIVRNDRLVGAIVMGDPGIVPSMLQAFADGTPLAPNRAELLFPSAYAGVAPSVDRMADTARICDCNAVSKGEIVQAVLEGADGVQSVGEMTRAGTGCGSCRPEVQSIVDFVRRTLDASSGAAPMPAAADGDNSALENAPFREACA
jgi:NAD(P)H-dependent nitrite reductase large subunit